jgi:FAD/FMN-containing dehydrogenase
VLASGEIANANRTANPDLWRALKGGAGNFGIVTRYDLATFKQAGIWGGSLGQDISSRQEVFEAFANIANGPEYDPYASIVSGYTFVANQWSIGHLMTYTKEVETPPAVYQPLLSIQPQTQNTLKNTNLSTLTNESVSAPTL